MNRKLDIETTRLRQLGASSHTSVPVVSEDEYNASDAWGLYTSVDVFECSERKIADEAAIRHFTIELCDRLGVTRYGEPMMVLFGDDPSIHGWSMAQMIETSLVSGHFIQSPKSAYVDIFSCRFYDAATIIRFAVEFFEGSSFTYHSVLREKAGTRGVDRLSDVLEGIQKPETPGCVEDC